MSQEHEVKVVRLGKIEVHPGADRLEITKVWDYPVVIGKGEFVEGDLGVFIPIDSVVPEGDPKFAFLKGHNRIRASRKRQFFSMGLLIPVPAGMKWKEGQEVSKELGITQYVPKEIHEKPKQKVLSDFTSGKPWYRKILGYIKFIIYWFKGYNRKGDNVKDPGYLPYYDIEGLLKYSHLLSEGEEVVLSEKIHGQCYSVLYKKKFWVKSHKMYKRNSPNSHWWKIARKYNLEKILKKHPGIGLYGEIYGFKVQKLTYDAVQSEDPPMKLMIFDVYDTNQKKFLDYDDAKDLVINKMKLPFVPELFRGKWNDDLRKYKDGNSVVKGVSHTREGFVVKCVKERYAPHFGRVILKLKGEKFLLSDFE